ncbi:cytochrome c553 [Bradyrhizobium japonicum]
MGTSIHDIKKSRVKGQKRPKIGGPKMGRPRTTGTGTPTLVRLHDQQLAAIDAWIAAQDGEISRPEAIRRLIELGLSKK